MENTYVVLNNGIKMPIVGFGTFKVEDGMQTVEAVKHALQTGYRHIDTAAIYNNEEGVGEGIRKSGVPREEIFLVSKVWNSDQGYEKTLEAFELSLKKLGTDYLDLYLIHWPKALNKETWKALEHLYKEGRVKAIGVSNFKEHHLEELLEVATVKPMVNQVELHPQLAQPELVAYCKAQDIQIEAWGPLMQGKVFEIPLMKELAQKYNRTVAQLTLRWGIQKDTVVIPKSINPSRIEGNFDVFNFEITPEDMARIETLNTGERIGPDPDNITF
ncbi:MAG: aldo/keto reductase [Cellulosilyticaceae bacterium]